MNNLPNFRHVWFSSLKNSDAKNLKVHCSIQRALSVENLNMRKARNVIRTKMHCGNYVLCIRMGEKVHMFSSYLMDGDDVVSSNGTFFAESFFQFFAGFIN